MAFLDSLINLLSSIESDKIAVHDERCVVMRNRNVECLRCVRACTSGALELTDGELAVHPEKCIGCGTCAAACPTSAIEVRTPTDAELTGALKRSIVATKGHPVIACEKAVRAARKQHEDAARLQGWRGTLGLKVKDAPALDETMLVEVPCLGRVDESLIAAMGAYRSLDGTLVCAHCEGCEHEPGGTQVMDVIESAESLMSAFGSSFSVKFTDEMPARLTTTESALAARAEQAAEKAATKVERAGSGAEAAGDPSPASSHGSSAPITDSAGSPAGESPADPGRRAFLASAKEASASLAAEAMADGLGLTDDTPAPKPMSPRYRKVNAQGTLSRFVPTRRTLLYNYLNRLGEPAADAVKNRVIGRVLIDTDACSSCRMCAVFCPTGALDRAEDGDFWGLVHRPAACVQCRSCESLCPKGAITVDDTVPMDQFMGREAVLFSMEKPTWQANKPDSMYNKIHSILGEDLEMCMF